MLHIKVSEGKDQIFVGIYKTAGVGTVFEIRKVFYSRAAAYDYLRKVSYETH